MKTSFIITLVGLFSQASFAAEDVQKNHPCKNIVAACEAGGFKKGAHKEKKGLWKDCVEVIKSGQSVPGVTVAESDVQECKARKERREEKRQARKEKRMNKAEKVEEAKAEVPVAPVAEPAPAKQ